MWLHSVRLLARLHLWSLLFSFNPRPPQDLELGLASAQRALEIAAKVLEFAKAERML